MSQRISGLQHEVRSLYRKVLRAAKDKERADAVGAAGTVQFARERFRETANSVRRSDFRLIEHLLRYGHKQLRLLSMPGVRA
ncbi:unnamed protein product, partial [Phaeothamnion confervicola]